MPEAGEARPDILVVSREADRLAAERLVAGEDGRPPRYEVVSIGSVAAMERWPGARTVVLWHSAGPDSANAMQAIGERLHGGSKTVKFMVGPSPSDTVEAGKSGWTEFYSWVQSANLVKPWSNGAFLACVGDFQNPRLPGEAQAPASPLEPVEQPSAGGSPDEPAAEEFLASLVTLDASIPEPEPADLQPEVPAYERSIVFAAVQRDRGEWPPIVDFWGEAADLPEIPFNCLPPAIAPYIFDQSALRGVDPCQASISCVVACSALIRESIYLQMKAESSGWKEHARLWGAIIGDPSSRKKVGVDLGFEVLKHLDLTFRAAEERALSEHFHADKIYQGQLADYYREAKKAPGAPRPEAPPYPPSNRLWTGTATLEALAKLLSRHDRGKTCVVKDELAAWFGEFDCYGNGKSDKDRPAYLSAYEGGETYIDRVTEGKSFHIPTWSLSILGGIQPDKLATIANKLGSDGMLQRFMLATSKPAVRDQDRKPDSAAEGRWQAVSAALLDMELHPATGPVRFSPEAQVLRRECSEWLERGMRAGFPPALTFALGKWEGLLGRLALTFHCIDAADRGRAFPDAFIPYDTLERAFNYIKDFLWPHALYFYEVAQPEDDKRPLRKIAGLVLVLKSAVIAPYQIGHKYTKWRDLDARQKREIFLALTEAGYIRPQSDGVHWDVNPALPDKFAERTAIIEHQRAEQDELRLKRGFRPRQPGED